MKKENAHLARNAVDQDLPCFHLSDQAIRLASPAVAAKAGKRVVLVETSTH